MTEKTSLIARLKALPNEAPLKVYVITLSICLVCALVVTSVSIHLQPIQKANAAAYQQGNALKVAGLTGVSTEEALADKRLLPLYVDLQTGALVTDVPSDYKTDEAANDPELSRPLSEDDDIAGLNRLEKIAPLYHVRDKKGRLERVVLPVRGKGLWSTLYGFLSLNAAPPSKKALPFSEIYGIVFYKHGETPGLGGRIEDEAWQASWQGKIAYDAKTGEVILKVGGKDGDIDALSGATMTTRGVDNLVRFWLGENGFKPYLTRLREEGGAK